METSLLKIIPSTTGKSTKAVIMLEGALAIENVEKIMKKTVSIINKYETIEFQIKNVTEIDLSFLQLFYALRIKSNTLNKKFIVITEFQAEIKRLIENAGLTSLFC